MPSPRIGAMRTTRDARRRMNRGHEISNTREGQGAAEQCRLAKRYKPRHVPGRSMVLDALQRPLEGVGEWTQAPRAPASPLPVRGSRQFPELAFQLCPAVEHWQDLSAGSAGRLTFTRTAPRSRNRSTWRDLRARRRWSPARLRIAPGFGCHLRGSGHVLLGVAAARVRIPAVAIADRAPRRPGNAPPSRIGGCGFCAGLGQVCIDGTLTISPSYSAVVLVQISFIASICSRIFCMRVVKTVPCASISSAFQPPPMPNRKRPPIT